MIRKVMGTFVVMMIISAGVQVGGNVTELIHPSEWKRMDVLATAYCPCGKCCGKWADGVTAVGKNAYSRGVAVDRSVIPLGSTLIIPGYGTVVADDVGGAIKNQHIDVRFNSHAVAREWGRKMLTIHYRAPN